MIKKSSDIIISNLKSKIHHLESIITKEKNEKEEIELKFSEINEENKKLKKENITLKEEIKNSKRNLEDFKRLHQEEIEKLVHQMDDFRKKMIGEENAELVKEELEEKQRILKSKKEEIDRKKEIIADLKKEIIRKDQEIEELREEVKRSKDKDRRNQKSKF